MSVLKCNRLENTSTASGGLDVDTSGKVRVTTLADSSGNNNSTPAEIASGRVKAWGTIQADGTIDSSYNVASVTKTGTGAYDVVFTNALPNANYAVVGNLQIDSTNVVYFDSKATTGFHYESMQSTGSRQDKPVGFQVTST